MVYQLYIIQLEINDYMHRIILFQTDSYEQGRIQEFNLGWAPFNSKF